MYNIKYILYINKILMKSIVKESEYQTVFTKVVHHLWWWIYKIPDIWNVRKPFDCIVAKTDTSVIKAVELKVAPTYKTNVKRLLKEHQVSNLSKLSPYSFVLCYYKKEKASSLFKVNSNWDLEEVICLKKLVEVCDYLLWID